jgi:quinol monooxygenase YgiN
VSDLAYIVVVRAKVGKSALLGAALAELVALSRQEAGCGICELNQSSDDPLTWMVYERWRDSEAFARHMEQSYTKQFLARMGDLTSEPADVRAFKYHA